jgi:hypothetical protein
VSLPQTTPEREPNEPKRPPGPPKIFCRLNQPTGLASHALLTTSFCAEIRACRSGRRIRRTECVNCARRRPSVVRERCCRGEGAGATRLSTMTNRH